MTNRIKHVVTLAVAAAYVTTATGCASMFHGTTQQIQLRSNDPGADLYVNEALVGRGSGVTTFRKNSNYVITARKQGCQPAMVSASKSFDPVSLLGILLDWGIISVLVVDGAATGAWKQFDQTSYVVDPVCPEVRTAAAR